MTTLDELLRLGTLTMEAGPRKQLSPDADFDQLHWRTRCRLSYRGRKMALEFRQGLGHHDAPTRRDVIEAVLSDAVSLTDADDFEEWAENFGFDTDSRWAERVYNSTVTQTKSLKKLLGDDFDLWIEALREDWN